MGFAVGLADSALGLGGAGAGGTAGKETGLRGSWGRGVVQAQQVLVEHLPCVSYTGPSTRAAGSGLTSGVERPFSKQKTLQAVMLLDS